MFMLAKELWPLNRRTGHGTYKTLQILKKNSYNLKIKYFLSGQKVLDWKIPDEWNVSEAWIKNSKGNTIVDFKNNNLHLVGYSKSINKYLSLVELKKKIYTLKDKSNSIPYVTSYYNKDWGFCMSYNKFKKLKNDKYKVLIKSNFKKGKMNYGEIFIKGNSSKEVLLSTYVCHPLNGK